MFFGLTQKFIAMMCAETDRCEVDQLVALLQNYSKKNLFYS